MMHLKDDILKKIRKKPNATQSLSNRIAIELKNSKTNYFQNYFHVKSKNMKLLWNGIKSIISVINPRENIIRMLQDTNGNVVTDPTKMANIFNNFFVNSADILETMIPRSPRSPNSVF